MVRIRKGAYGQFNYFLSLFVWLGQVADSSDSLLRIIKKI